MIAEVVFQVAQWWWLALAAIALVLAWYLTFLARRLDRLHRRVEGAAAALDLQLLRRAQAVIDVSVTGLLDPASQVLLHTAAGEAIDQAPDVPVQPMSRLAGYPAMREEVESNLSGLLRATFEDLPAEHPQLVRPETEELAAACQRAQLARRLHNDAAVTALTLRRKRTIRWLRLAGAAPLPRTIEIDDQPPAVLLEPRAVPG